MFILNTPIIIPSYYKEGRKQTIDLCLNSIFEFYIVKSKVVVIAQNYPDPVLKTLENKFSQVVFNKTDSFSDGIVGAFNFCHFYMNQLFDSYIFMEDDIKLIKAKGKHYPILTVYEEVLKDKRVGIVGTLPKNLQWKEITNPKDLIRFTGNPAHIIGFNSEATKDLKKDLKFKNFRTDTDITLQVLKQNFGLILFVDKITYHHMNPISKLDKETKSYKLIYSNSNSTNTRSEDSWLETERALADKWSLKINKNGRALYEQFVRKNNPFHSKNYLKEVEKFDILPIWEMLQI